MPVGRFLFCPNKGTSLNDNVLFPIRDMKKQTESPKIDHPYINIIFHLASSLESMQ